MNRPAPIRTAPGAVATASGTTFGPRLSVAYYIQDAGRMFVVGYKVDAPDCKPVEATESDLRSIVASFHVTP